MDGTCGVNLSGPQVLHTPIAVKQTVKLCTQPLVETQMRLWRNPRTLKADHRHDSEHQDWSMSSWNIGFTWTCTQLRCKLRPSGLSSRDLRVHPFSRYQEEESPSHSSDPFNHTHIEHQTLWVYQGFVGKETWGAWRAKPFASQTQEAWVPRKRSPTLSWCPGTKLSSRDNWCKAPPHHRAPASRPRNTPTHVLHYFWVGWLACRGNQRKKQTHKNTQKAILTGWVFQDFWMVQLPRGWINFLPSWDLTSANSI